MRCAAGHRCRPAQRPTPVRQLSESSAALSHEVEWLEGPMPCLVVLQWLQLSSSDAHLTQIQTLGTGFTSHARRRKRQRWVVKSHRDSAQHPTRTSAAGSSSCAALKEPRILHCTDSSHPADSERKRISRIGAAVFHGLHHCALPD